MTDSNKNPAANERFGELLEGLIQPGLPAKELVMRIVRATLETEFGRGFTLSKGFDKMIGTIADAIVTNPDLRRESLVIASKYMTKNRKQQ